MTADTATDGIGTHNDADILVVGAGPAGAIVALEAARSGHRVIAVDQRSHQDHRQRSGALLTPRAIHSLARHGIDIASSETTGSTAHRIDNVRVTDDADPRRSTSVPWPADVLAPNGETYPSFGLVIDRRELDRKTTEAAVAAGADIRYGIDAIGPVVDRGFVRGAIVAANDGRNRELRATYTVIADGANSRFGRSLGTFRTRGWPYALGHRGRFQSRLSHNTEVEFVVGLRDASGGAIAGHAWMFPCGDGTVVVGVLVMSTSTSFRVVKPERLLARIIETHRHRWHLDPEPTMPTSGSRLPLGTSVRPIAGPTYLLVGDAAGAANPFTGAGLEYALETGGIAAQVLSSALEFDAATELQRYPAMVEDAYGSYFKFGRLANRLLSNGLVAPRFASLVAGHPWAADALLRIGGNELRRRTDGLAELIVAGGRLVDAITPAA